MGTFPGFSVRVRRDERFASLVAGLGLSYNKMGAGRKALAAVGRKMERDTQIGKAVG